MNKNPDTDAFEILDEYKTKISQAIVASLDDYKARWQQPDVSADSAEALELLTDISTRSGKLIRGTLAWYTYDQLSNVSNLQAGANLAVAVEFIQNYLLIIDDVMDRSAQRRGGPTIHELYISKFRNIEGSGHLANMMAVSVGLLAQHLANDLILNSGETDENINKTLSRLHQNIIATCYGQIDDLVGAYNDDMPTKEMIYSIYEAKSSYYTFINPLQMGAALAGRADKKLLDKIEEFGKPAGIAFQLQDDILGMFGNSKQTGKPNLDDLREGKRTLLILYALEMCNKADQDIIKSALGNSDLNHDDHRRVSSIIEQCGARHKVETEALGAAQKAVQIINSAEEFSLGAKAFYSRIVDYAIKRDK